MCTRTKRRVVSVLACMFMAVLVFAFSTLLPKNMGSVSASAVGAPQELRVDNTGYLRWKAASDATGYQWSYSTNGGSSYSDPITCVGEEADISGAINEAVVAAQAGSQAALNLKFKVKALPEGGESTVDYVSNRLDGYYRPDDSKKLYVDLGYTQHDITERVPATAVEGGMSCDNRFNVPSVMHMNELMTFSLMFDSGSTDGSYAQFEILGNGVNATNSGTYGLLFLRSGQIQVYSSGTKVYTSTMPALTVNARSFFTVGVLDTYKVQDGTWVGETLSILRQEVVNGKPTYVDYLSVFFDSRLTSGSGSQFVCPSDRPATLPNAKNHTVVNPISDKDAGGNNLGTVPKGGLRLVNGGETGHLASGELPAISGTVEAPTQVYYDNVSGQVKWNRVGNATSYEWTYAGKNGWETVQTDCIPADEVASVLATAKAAGVQSVRFAVRAVGASGKSLVEYYTVDLNAFYKSDVRTTLKDLSQISTALQDPSVTLTAKYSYSEGFGKNTFVENAFVFNATRADYRLMVGLHAEKWMTQNGYVVSIFANGKITIARDSTQYGSAGYETRLFIKPSIAFELGKKYIATYGVEDLFDASGNKVADRITVRISEYEADGYRKVLTTVSYDNYEYATGSGVPNAEYTNRMNLLCSPYGNSLCTLSCVNSTYAYQITPVVNGKALTEQMQTITYGQAYDFTSVLQTPGYDFSNAEWKYKLTDDGEEQDFYLKGNWIIPFANGVGTVYTTATAINYTIDYVMPNGITGVTTSNATSYTVEDTINLTAPENIPNGYTFKGWYKDQAYTQEITSIEEMTGNLTIYAKIEGYSVTINDRNGNQVSKEVSENASYTLPSYSESGVIGYDVDGALYKAGDTIAVSEDIVIEEVWLNFVMVDGAKVRLSSAGDYYGGLRFVINADSAAMEKYAEKIQIFGMIAPTDTLDGAFDGVGERVNVIELTEYSTKDGVNVYNITLTNVLYTNYNRAFSARGYLVIAYASGTQTVYTDYSVEKNSRSVYEVACKATADDTVTQDAKDVLANYLSYTVNLVKDGDTYTVATTQDNLPVEATRKYTVENGVVTLTNIPARLIEKLTEKAYVPVTVYEGNTSYRILVAVTLDGTTASGSLVE